MNDVYDTETAARRKTLALMLQVLEMTERMLAMAKIAPPASHPQTLMHVGSTVALAERDLGALATSERLGHLADDERVGLTTARERLARVQLALRELRAFGETSPVKEPERAPASEAPGEAQLRRLRTSALDALEAAERLFEVAALTSVGLRPRVLGDAMERVHTAQRFVHECRSHATGRLADEEEREYAVRFASRLRSLSIKMAELNPTRGQA